MVTTGLRAPLPAVSTRDAPRPPLRLAEVPPPPPGEVIPGYGYVVISPGERLTIAGHLLAIHEPDGPALQMRRSWPFLAVNDRACEWCHNPWPCSAASWAEQVQVDAFGWAL
ncbi:hypothetical protein ABIH81_18910 [Micromonospora sp. HUAS YX12]|uniref:Uncharacterized protein n=1 Tax=Micromonospora sp. HUAS YX12 TaxID=3156396 RepID=A0AAU7QUG4_9ACTN